MRNLTINPIRANEWRNSWFSWPRRKQVLGSMLLWASRAGATRIDFDPEREEPIIYSNETCVSIVTELGPPPEHAVDSLMQYFRNIAMGDRWFGVLPAKANQAMQTEISATIRVPDVESTKVHCWQMTVCEKTAKFVSKCFDEADSVKTRID